VEGECAEFARLYPWFNAAFILAPVRVACFAAQDTFARGEAGRFAP